MCSGSENVPLLFIEKCPQNTKETSAPFLMYFAFDISHEYKAFIAKYYDATSNKQTDYNGAN